MFTNEMDICYYYRSKTNINNGKTIWIFVIFIAVKGMVSYYFA
jgi:hypothetical protein